MLAVLPEGLNYIFETCEIIETGDESELQFKVEGRVNVQTKAELHEFIEEFSNITGSSYNILSGRQDKQGKKTILHGFRKCIMNVKHENERKFLRSGLQRNCPSDLKFRLDMVPVRNERDTDERKKKKELVENYPLHFCINFQHNHQLKRHEHSRFGNVSQETKNRYFFNTFQLNSTLLSVSSFCNAQSHCCHFHSAPS